MPPDHALVPGSFQGRLHHRRPNKSRYHLTHMFSLGGVHDSLFLACQVLGYQRLTPIGDSQGPRTLTQGPGSKRLAPLAPLSQNTRLPSLAAGIPAPEVFKPQSLDAIPLIADAVSSMPAQAQVREKKLEGTTANQVLVAALVQQ